jgi:RimJ/RimL family protein N-acetyltransferase
MPFDLQPELHGELVGLRPLRPDDFANLHTIASDPLIWEQHPAADRYKEHVFREFFREALQSGGALVALDSKNGAVMGSSRYYGYDEQAGEIEIGWTFLARSYWGGIYNGEMKRLMLDHAFAFVNRVILIVGPRNFRSQRAAENVGALRTGTRRGADGTDNIVFEITRSTYSRPQLARR